MLIVSLPSEIDLIRSYPTFLWPEQHPLLSQLSPPGAEGTHAVRLWVSRIQQWISWQAAWGQPWCLPDMAAWRDDLVARGRKPRTIQAYLSTIRAAYSDLLRQNYVRDALYGHLRDTNLPLSEKQAIASELERRIQNAVHPRSAAIDIPHPQDFDDRAFIRLSAREAGDLMAKPGLSTLRGLRDTALLSLILCTGIRAAEAAALMVAHLRGQLGGELALIVADGKGQKQRLIPYGIFDWSLALTELWLDKAEIADGPVFVPINKGGTIQCDQRLSTNAISLILKQYIVTVQGRPTTLNPHDLRRTYARRLYETGMDLLSIQQNLGHHHQKTTQAYIGNLDGRKRAPYEQPYNMDWLEPIWKRVLQRDAQSLKGT